MQFTIECRTIEEVG